MRQATLFSGLAALLPSAVLAYSNPNMLDARQDKPAYEELVCKPQTGSDNQVPPCVQIENIEVTCKPNGTESTYLDAHAQCMCTGSFFAEKLACESCLFTHGLRSERDLAYYRGILSSASSALCTGTPTAAFADIYSNIAAAATPITTGGTSMSDRAVSNTAISLYYTASGPQGPGTITGAAANATRTGSPSSDEATATATVTRSSSSNTSGSSSAATSGTASDAAATTATDSGARSTFAAGGLLVGAAGLAAFMGL